MITLKTLFLGILCLFCLLSVAIGQGSSSDHVEDIIKSQTKIIEKLGRDPVIVKAVKEQNSKKVPLSEIQSVDKIWCANSGTDDLMKRLMSNVCAERLKSLAGNLSLYGETFAMDNQGAIVGMTSKTSDYWQGDESKWKRSFNDGKGAVFVDKPQYDTSSKTILVQISVPVRDADGTTIGALTVGVNIEKQKVASKAGK